MNSSKLGRKFILITFEDFPFTLISMKISQFIFIGRLEVFSFLILLFIAMPMKYFMGFPSAVKYVGWAHGVLFILYAAGVAMLGYKYKWRFIRMFLLFIAAFIPFGPILMEKRVLYGE